MCGGVLHACMPATCICALPLEYQKGVEAPATGVTATFVCWESNPKPLEEQTGLLSTEPSRPLEIIQTCQNQTLLGSKDKYLYLLPTRK